MEDTTQETDPWKRAQEGPFMLSAAKAGAERQATQTRHGDYGREALVPAGEKKPERRRRITAAIAAAMLGLAVLGGIVLAVYLYVRSAGRTAVVGVNIAERTQAEIALDNALKTEIAHYMDTGGFTDDKSLLRSRMPSVLWEQGSNPQRRGAVYVQVCDTKAAKAASVLLQIKTERGTVFSLWSYGPSNMSYFSLGPTSCPVLNEKGVPPSPWTTSKSEGWGNSVPEGGAGSEPIEIPPPAGAPKPPSIRSPYGGSGSTDYGYP